MWRKIIRCMDLPFVLLQSVLLLTASTEASWGGSKNSENIDMSMFQTNNARDWLQYSSLEIKYNGCVWFDVNKGGDENGGGCLGNEDGDGDRRRLGGDGDMPWYTQANCKLAQVVYSVYGSETGGGCGRGKFLDTFITNRGISGFAQILSNYAQKSSLSYYDVQDLPSCEYGDDGYYHAVGCSSNGDFVIDAFDDFYCSASAWVKTVDKLSSINSKLKSISCMNCQSSSSYLCEYLIMSSDSCSPIDTEICKKTSGKSITEYTFKHGSSKNSSGGRNYGSVIMVKLKNALTFFFFLASIIMTVGIMYTNRRKRRALMHRKFRNGADPGSSRRTSTSRILS
uniref:Uncharacterized protein n=1 Tax=Corethron hystrix TaxID=216773 RepID=A0A7S1BV66_9STRA|mmetsp:Transcript_41182/g.96594  ORF Transcript_41182/g.96594 Transcript_41182/m.96594 type:complete len:340 (+) Transcript_41182:124-1143(+)